MSTEHPSTLALAARRAAEAAGGSSALARHLGVSPSAVSNWRNTRIPAERLPRVSEITGIPMRELRPDICPTA